MLNVLHLILIEAELERLKKEKAVRERAAQLQRI
jgi:hypothetical protein